MRVGTRSVLSIVTVFICAAPLIAQQGKTNQGATPSSTSTGALPGLNYPTPTLERFIKPPEGKDFVYLCYRLVPVISFSAPFSLQGVSQVDGSNITCETVDADHPLKSGKKIVLALDTSLIVDLSRVQNLNVNITFTQGTTISQRAVRPSVSGNIPVVALSANHLFYLLVTDRLAGDAVPQLSVSVLYDPPVPGQPWAGGTIYPVGSIVTGPNGEGHFYQAQVGGMSAIGGPGTALQPVLASDIADNNCHWSPYGIQAPGGAGITAIPWLPSNTYKPKDVVYIPAANMFYVETANLVSCISDVKNHFPMSPPAPKSEPNTSTTPDGGGGNMQWKYVQDGCPGGARDWKTDTDYPSRVRVCHADMGVARLYESTVAGHSGLFDLQFKNPSTATQPFITKEPSTAVDWEYLSDGCEQNSVPAWMPNHDYKTLREKICQSGVTSHLYQVITSGRSGAASPYFANPDNQTARPQWVDIGVFPPAAVNSASATEIQTNAISIPLAQVHFLAYYNVATGVLVSTIRVPSFSYTTPTSVNNGTPVKTGSALLVDPVITLTRYFWGFDAEAKEHHSDWRPGLSLSFSLSAPTNNFYIGGSSEPLRYVQLEYGFVVAKVPSLPSGAFAPPSSSTPSTTPVFRKGAYIGLSFNLSDFVKSL